MLKCHLWLLQCLGDCSIVRLLQLRVVMFFFDQNMNHLTLAGNNSLCICFLNELSQVAVGQCVASNIHSLKCGNIRWPLFELWNHQVIILWAAAPAKFLGLWSFLMVSSVMFRWLMPFNYNGGQTVTGYKYFFSHRDQSGKYHHRWADGSAQR